MTTERVYSDWERETALWQAEREGDKAAAETWGCSPTTIRSWRHRAERKTGDRDREGGAGGSSSAPASLHHLANVQVPTDLWDGGLGCYRKVPARARVLERFEVGGQFISQGELRELRAPGTAGLAVGDLVLLGGSRFAEFRDALWCIAERGDGRLLVRPAKIRRDERLSEDRSRIVRKGPDDKPRGYISPEERAAMWNSQPDPIVEWHRRQLERLGQSSP